MKNIVAGWMLVAALATGACKKAEDKAATPAPTTATEDAAAATPPPAAVDAAPAAPKLPSLGPAPAGMDKALADACEGGDGKACFAAAEGYSPKGAYRVNLSKEEADLKEANTAKWASRACELDSADGCALAARFLGGNEETKAATRACELGHAGMCGDLGWSQDTAEGIALLEKACRGNGVGVMGSLPGQYCDWLATRLQGKDADKPFKDLAKAKEVKALSCQQGFKPGCPCKEDKECGELDGYELFCSEDICVAPSAD